ncbi:hypothetical protein IEQ34_003305 [Dendrobium chrysotoxum]|uniref:Uncharacterized protein n=1 Tax=Dendrobium chrysotoxum TaxID=161865 RepID=A0AAV7HK89_DENCH|nr:hypothetical protein IEQ34_003305 [Dendrobium chrysotoxum]
MDSSEAFIISIDGKGYRIPEIFKSIRMQRSEGHLADETTALQHFGNQINMLICIQPRAEDLQYIQSPYEYRCM